MRVEAIHRDLDMRHEARLACERAALKAAKKAQHQANVAVKHVATDAARAEA